jgi:Delta24-sterol reductase
VPVPLYDVLSLNERELTVRVEPMVTVAEITDYLIPKGNQITHFISFSTV